MKVSICIDLETLSYFSPGPWQSKKDKIKWNLNKFLWPIRYAQDYEGIFNLYNYVRYYNLPITLFAVEPIRNIISEWDWPSSTDIGSHSYSHECLITMDDRKLDAEFERISPGISFAAPMNKINDIDNKNRIFKKLTEKGFKIIRYQGDDSSKKKKQFHYDCVSVPKQIYPGLKCVCGTMYFEGTSPLSHLNKIKATLESYKNLPNKVIFCLSTHDFTWKKNNMFKFEKVVGYIQNNFKMVSLKGLVE